MRHAETGSVSVIVPLYNREDMIVNTIRSVIAQETKAPLEIIVIDDGSIDEGFAVVKQLQKKHPNIILERQKNRGVCAARNRGFDLSTGEFIQFLDSDDKLDPHKFTKQISALESNPKADFCTSNTVFLYEDGMQAPGFELDKEFSQDAFLTQVLSRNLWHVHAPLYRRQAIDRIGLWNEHLTCLEDWEYSCRAAIADCQVVHIPEALAMVQQHEGERLSHRPVRVVSEHLRTIFSAMVSELESGKACRQNCDQVACHLFSAGRGFVECGVISEGEACFAEARRAAKGGNMQIRLYMYSAMSKLIGHRRFLYWSRALASKVKSV